ncbi:ROK family transcriptional regulator [Actinocorallia aurantiaca]
MDRPTDALHRLRRVHEDTVLAALRTEGPLSRGRLTERTGLSRTTLFAIIADLIERGVVAEVLPEDDLPRGRGRPAGRITLAPGSGMLIGLDLGRRRIRLAVANVAHEIVATAVDDLPADADEDEQLDCAIALIHKVCEERGISLRALEAIGVGLVGFVDGPARRERAAGRLGAEFGARVEADNNARLAALAEKTWGAARSVDDVVYVRWSVGVGGGFIAGGRLLRGAHGTAGELGHVSIDPGGEPCHCGSRGCLEGLIGSPALLTALAADGVILDGLDALIEAARDREPAVTRRVSEAGALLGRALAGTIVQLDPRRVVVGGEFASLGGLVLDPIRAAVAGLALPGTPRSLDLVPADLGATASALGAIALVLNEDPAIPRHLRP